MKRTSIALVLLVAFSIITLSVAAQGCPGNTFVGYGGGSCKDISSQSECASSFAVNSNGFPVACYFDSNGEDNDQEEGPGCYACGPSNFNSEFCTNDCATCEKLPSRDFAGNGGGSCKDIESESECEESFATTGEGGSTPVPCYFDSTGFDHDQDGGDPEVIGCYACGPTNFQDGFCDVGCVSCPNSPSKQYAGPRGNSCKAIEGESECEDSFATTSEGQPTNCYFDSNGEDNDQEEGPGCYACGPSNDGEGFCSNECIACKNDPSRNFVGFGGGNCRDIGQNQEECEDSFATSGEGSVPSPCYFDSTGFDHHQDGEAGFGTGCFACGPTNFFSGFCTNTCLSGPPPEPINVFDMFIGFDIAENLLKEKLLFTLHIIKEQLFQTELKIIEQSLATRACDEQPVSFAVSKKHYRYGKLEEIDALLKKLIFIVEKNPARYDLSSETVNQARDLEELADEISNSQFRNAFNCKYLAYNLLIGKSPNLNDPDCECPIEVEETPKCPVNLLCTEEGIEFCETGGGSCSFPDSINPLVDQICQCNFECETQEDCDEVLDCDEVSGIPECIPETGTCVCTE